MVGWRNVRNELKSLRTVTYPPRNEVNLKRRRKEQRANLSQDMLQEGREEGRVKEFSF